MGKKTFSTTFSPIFPSKNTGIITLHVYTFLSQNYCDKLKTKWDFFMTDLREITQSNMVFKTFIKFK